ncbi:MAG: hypothetical protein COB26_03030 [Piscirickettsiaceae bacterium]|nr:MAG: hypothetical protein COB26_03030 [Piscirickettsiaceae bacterium]
MSQRFCLQKELKYKQVGNECLVYQLAKGNTLLLETLAVDVLQFLTNKPSTLAQLKSQYPHNEVIEGTVEHLVDAGLLIQII